MLHSVCLSNTIPVILAQILVNHFIHLLWFGSFISDLVYFLFNSYFNSLLKFNINPLIFKSLKTKTQSKEE